jgi:hypothetical protein
LIFWTDRLLIAEVRTITHNFDFINNSHSQLHYPYFALIHLLEENCYYQLCRSGMFIPDPIFIRPGSQKRRGGNLFSYLFFVATIISKFKAILFLNWKRKNLQFTKICLPKNLSVSSQKYGLGIRDPEKPIPDHGSRGQKGTGSRILIRNTAVIVHLPGQFFKTSFLSCHLIRIRNCLARSDPEELYWNWIRI